MSKIAFIFPGQGAQKIGMGQEFYENTQIGKEVFDKASEAVGLDLKALCFEENDNINITEFTQVALVTTSVAMMKVLEDKGVKPDVAAGLSLGEYCALVATGAMDYLDAAKAVRQRGILMQEEVPTGVGAMAAVIGMDKDTIEESISDIEHVSIANYNCPGQIVISGRKEAVEEASEKLKEAGARRCLMLKVSGPFHSDMLQGAGKKLEKVLDEIQINQPQFPYAANVTAEYVTDVDDIKPLLVKQVSSSVRWQQTIEMMIDDGVDTFIEIGPGKTLAGFNKKIGKALDKELQTYNVETLADVDAVVEALA